MMREHVGDRRVQSIAYDNMGFILEVESTSGAIYQFINVPPSVMTDLRNTASKERYIFDKVAGVFQSVKVKDEPPEVVSWITNKAIRGESQNRYM